MPISICLLRTSQKTLFSHLTRGKSTRVFLMPLRLGLGDTLPCCAMPASQTKYVSCAGRPQRSRHCTSLGRLGGHARRRHTSSLQRLGSCGWRWAAVALAFHDGCDAALLPFCCDIATPVASESELAGNSISLGVDARGFKSSQHHTPACTRRERPVAPSGPASRQSFGSC